jgi:hypothetical protein
MKSIFEEQFVRRAGGFLLMYGLRLSCGLAPSLLDLRHSLATGVQ